MMGGKPSFEGLKDRIDEDFAHYGGTLPERAAIAWYGYLAALIEWGLVSVSEHERLVQLLPPVESNPATDILVGRS
jgi:hypothetical protein